MNDIEDLINSLQNDKVADANNLFNQALGAKITDALNTKKVELANQVYNGMELNTDANTETDTAESE
jgi:hypothetical protein